MLRGVRDGLLCRLAGRDTVVINATIRDGTLTIGPGDNAFICGCRCETTLTHKGSLLHRLWNAVAKSGRRLWRSRQRWRGEGT